MLASEVVSYWDAMDMEDTAVSWSMTVTLKSLSDDDFFLEPPVIAHSKVPGLEAAEVEETCLWPAPPDNIVAPACW